MNGAEPLDLGGLRTFPLSERASLSSLADILVDPESDPQPLPERVERALDAIALRIRSARASGGSVILIYGAHLVRNGAALILAELMERGWLTHLATNGAGTIHDWEYAWLGRSTESVRDGVAHGRFGTWEETGRNIHLALLVGGISGSGYGRSLGGFIAEDGVSLPDPRELETAIREHPADPLTPAAVELLAAMRRHGLEPGRHVITHPYKHGSILAAAFACGAPVSVHAGIGYDITATHPMFNGAVIGRASGLDFAAFCGAVERLDGGVVLSVGSAIMGPQVFEKSLSCVNNLRLQAGRPIVSGHTIAVVDLQDGGGWDWSCGEPPKTNPSYYLRFCKSYARMGGDMQYFQCDNTAFIHHLSKRLAGE